MAWTTRDDLITMCVLCAVVMVLFVTAMMLLVRAVTAEEYHELMRDYVKDTRSREWALEHLQTGDIICNFAPSFEGENFWQAHCVTHVAIVVRLDPGEAFENVLVWEVRKRRGKVRDPHFITLKTFFRTYAGSAEALLVRRLERPLNTDALVRAARAFSSCVYDNRVQVQQMNLWWRSQPFTPLLPQGQPVQGAGYCSLFIVALLIDLGVLSPEAAAHTRNNIFPPVELILPAAMSTRPKPLEQLLLPPHRWLPLMRVVQEESLRIAAAERRGDWTAARRIRRALQDARNTEKRRAQEEHNARRFALSRDAPA